MTRIAATIPTLIGILILVFVGIHLVPGDPVLAVLGDKATVEQIDITRRDLGLDHSLIVQFFDYIRGLATGDLGTSIANRQPVSQLIASRLPSTAALALTGAGISVVLGIPLGVIGAVRRGRLGDVVALIVSTVGISAPSFWIGILLSTLFAAKLGWLPATGAGTPGDPTSTLLALILPGAALGLSGMALVARMTRSAMLDVLGEDYIRTARAKGARERRVVYKHALRNAAIPIMTVVGLNFGHLLGGTIVMETVFARPGIGTLLYNAILARDYPIVQGVTLVIAFTFVLINYLTDATYGLLDPRLKGS